MSEENFLIKTKIFEGPISLLLHLIEEKKLHINELSLSEVTDDYINYIERKEEFSIPDNSDFILIASTLLLIKSKSLLPTLDLTREEEEDISNLEERIKLYKFFRDLGKHIDEKFGKNPIYFKEDKPVLPVFSPHEKLKPRALYESVLSVIKNLPKKSWTKEATIKKVISLQEEMTNLSERIQKTFKMRFSEYSQAHKGEKRMIIVSFIAILELIKRGILAANQNNPFEDIELENTSLGLPDYK